ncbi:MAG TPA: hypothetical protein VMH39_14095 [Gemmatimonadaceae bacterium]|nr:hypothetical protein [Gemmatimonadaceae bacterium]
MLGTMMALLVMSVTPPGPGPVLATQPPVCAEQQQFDFEVDMPARFIGDTVSGPHPTAATANPANLVQFVVDTSGHVMPNTFLALRISDSTLVKDARAAAEGWRYTPAVSGECKVPQLVQTPVAR